VVPSAAIQRNAQNAFVYVINNGTATVHNVTTGTADNNLTAVQGINPGDTIATAGFDKLQDGIEVTLPGQNGGGRQGGGRGNRGGGSTAANGTSGGGNGKSSSGDPAQ
jgi:multidrug efflux system membrane fusion protein